MFINTHNAMEPKTVIARQISTSLVRGGVICAVWGVMCAVLLSTSLSARASELLGVRFGPDGNKTRIVFDLVGAPDFEITGDLDGNGRILITFHDMASGPEGINGYSGKGLVQRWAYAPTGQRTTQFVLDLKKTARIYDLFILDPSGSVKKHRLVIDIEVATPAAFMASIPKSERQNTEQTDITTIVAQQRDDREPVSKSQELGKEPKSTLRNEDTLAAIEPGNDRVGELIARTSGQNPTSVIASADIELGPTSTSGGGSAKPVTKNRGVEVQRPGGPVIMTNRRAEGLAITDANSGGAKSGDANSGRVRIAAAPSLKPVARLDQQNISQQDTTREPSKPKKSKSLFSRSTKKSKPSKSDRITIVIDPGHGGGHPGAIGPSGIMEKDVNLLAAKTLKDILNASGRYNVILTRDSDIKVELEQRSTIARSNGADLFISLHADGNNDNTLRGSSVYTLSAEGEERSFREAQEQGSYEIYNDDISKFDPVVGKFLFDIAQKDTRTFSQQFAHNLLERLTGVTTLIKNANRSEDLKVLLSPDVPAVLLEMAFISNRTDEANLTNTVWLDKMMQAVANAIDDYFDNAAPRRQANGSGRTGSLSPSRAGAIAGGSN